MSSLNTMKINDTKSSRQKYLLDETQLINLIFHVHLQGGF